MIKEFLSVCCLIFPQLTVATDNECYQALSKGGDSSFFQLVLNEDGYNPKKIIYELIHKQCGQSANVSVLFANCFRFHKGDPASQVCYLDTNYGYFFVSKDYLDNVNIIFSRFD